MFYGWLYRKQAGFSALNLDLAHPLSDSLCKGACSRSSLILSCLVGERQGCTLCVFGWHGEDWTGALCLNTDMAELVSGWSTGSLGFPQWCQSCDVSHGHLRLWGTAVKWKLLKICEKYFQGMAVFPLTYGFIKPMINSWDTHLLRLARFSPKCLLIAMPVPPKIQWKGSSFQMSSTTEFLIGLI